jgi:hypothetical protein
MESIVRNFGTTTGNGAKVALVLVKLRRKQ